MKKFLAALVVLVVAAGISLPLTLSGNSRPTPEQYLQSLVSQPLHWQKVNGIDTATIPGRALKFEVGPTFIRVFVEVGKTYSLKNQNQIVNGDVALAAQFVEHYMGWHSVLALGNAIPQALTYYETFGPGPTIPDYVTFDVSPNGRILKIGIDSDIDYVVSVSN